MQIPPAEPKTLAEMLWYIDYYKPNIYVRDQIDGKWGSYNLEQLSKKQVAIHIADWIERGIIPARTII